MTTTTGIMGPLKSKLNCWIRIRDPQSEYGSRIPGSAEYGSNADPDPEHCILGYFLMVKNCLMYGAFNSKVWLFPPHTQKYVRTTHSYILTNIFLQSDIFQKKISLYSLNSKSECRYHHSCSTVTNGNTGNAGRSRSPG